jgi:hypothetical protein
MTQKFTHLYCSSRLPFYSRKSSNHGRRDAGTTPSVCPIGYLCTPRGVEGSANDILRQMLITGPSADQPAFHMRAPSASLMLDYDYISPSRSPSRLAYHAVFSLHRVPYPHNMRLLNTSTQRLEEFFGEPPPYAILSHTWYAPKSVQ